MKQLILIMLLGLLASCNKSDNFLVHELPNLGDYELKAAIYVDIFNADFQNSLPNYLVTMGLSQHVIDRNKANLGRIVFYDESLSLDGKISCASCHKQNRAFADDVAFSKGVTGHLTARNSMSLGNVASFAAHYASINGVKPDLLWDGRAADIVNQAPMAFTNPHEMGLTMAEVIEKAKAREYYPYFMLQAYGDPAVTESRLLEGLQEFVHAMGSASSKLDKALDKVNGDLFGTSSISIPITAQRDSIISSYLGVITITDTVGTDTIIKSLLDFSESELRGRSLFSQNCTKCHSPIRSLQSEFLACNGLDMNYVDQGLGDISSRQGDKGVFKSPSLRNIAFTAPYMHDGRFKTLHEVLDFYSTGIQSHPNLHPLLRDSNGQALKMNFSDQDKLDLLAFLKTMNSYDVGTDSRFSNPFH